MLITSIFEKIDQNITIASGESFDMGALCYDWRDSLEREHSPFKDKCSHTFLHLHAWIFFFRMSIKNL